MLLFNLLLALQQSSPEFALPRTSNPPTIDGSIEDGEWAGALALDNWLQTKPGDNIAPAGKTIAWISYDHSSLYMAIRAWDDRSGIRYRLNERDAVAMQGQDWVNIHLDTFNDRRRAFAIALNPLGLQGDWIEIEGASFTEWDGMFDSRGKVLEDGWSVELRIPFATLRYPGSVESQSWGISLSRFYGRSDMQDYPWPRNRDLACNLCQMATLTGIHDIESSRAVEFNPILVARGGSARPDVPEPFGSVSGEVEPGANIKVGLSRGLTFDGTVIPTSRRSRPTRDSSRSTTASPSSFRRNARFSWRAATSSRSAFPCRDRIPASGSPLRASSTPAGSSTRPSAPSFPARQAPSASA
jgi:hypothetical protein